MWIGVYYVVGHDPATGLSPIIRIRDIEDGSVSASGTMTDKGEGLYAYEFVGYDITKDYTVFCDAITLYTPYRYKHATTNEYGDIINGIHLVTDEIDFRMELVKKIWRNRLDLTDGDTNNLVIYDDDNTTPLLEWDVTDMLDESILQQRYNTSKRTKGT